MSGKSVHEDLSARTDMKCQSQANSLNRISKIATMDTLSFEFTYRNDLV